MSAQLGRSVLNDLETLFNPGSETSLSDAELLDRFVRNRDEQAFHAIVKLHGPMVLGICRRALARPEDADDAFQATFLILVQKAKTLRDPHGVGGWLHGVATKVASRCRQQVEKRPDPLRLSREKSRDSPDSELMAILDAELSRLPVIFRDPIVLCHLEGHTHEQAAARLGWPVGTVRSRLSRGRQRLRTMLTRRGVATSVGLPLVTNPLPTSDLVGKVIGLLSTTVALAPQIRSLSQGVLWTMLLTSLARTAFVFSAVAVGVSGGAYVASGAWQKPESETSSKLAPPSSLVKPVTRPIGNVAIASDPVKDRDEGARGGSTAAPLKLELRLKIALRSLEVRRSLHQRKLIGSEDMAQAQDELDFVKAEITQASEDADDEMERLIAELQLKQAQVKLVETRQASQRSQLVVLEVMRNQARISANEVTKAEGNLKELEGELGVVQADRGRTEVSLRQATRKADLLKKLKLAHVTPDGKPPETRDNPQPIKPQPSEDR